MNGNWKNWILGIAASLFVVGFGMSYKTNLSVAETLGGLKVSITTLTTTMNKLDTTMNKEIEKLELRVRKLEDKD